MKKIVIFGPESTGKSTLCAALAKNYNTIWCKEYARQYLTENGTDYTFEDLLTIAKGQLALEAEAVMRANNILIVDTDMYVMKVWCEFVFGKCHNFILQQAALQRADLYLLCNTDLPWTKDELREYPDYENRAKLFLYYKDIAINSGAPWAIVSGMGEARTQCAIDAIDNLISKQ